MRNPSVLVLRAAGINCDEETMHCWRLAGANPTLMHVNAVAADPRILDDIAVVTIPGGFAYGDDIAAGAILAQRILLDLADPLRKLVQRGGGILGICNGFQVLVKAGLLPGPQLGRDVVTVTYNDSAHFEARWVKLKVCTDRCPFLTPGAVLEMPVEHGEGKVVTANDADTRRLASLDRIAVRYVDDDGRFDRYPANPNGSVDGIAGLCDDTGRIFGLMPHPDRNFDPTHHPHWTRRRSTGLADRHLRPRTDAPAEPITDAGAKSITDARTQSITDRHLRARTDASTESITDARDKSITDARAESSAIACSKPIVQARSDSIATFPPKSTAHSRIEPVADGLSVFLNAAKYWRLAN